MKHAILTSGYYSDYSIEGLIEYPDGLDLRALWREWQKANPFLDDQPSWRSKPKEETEYGARWIEHVLSLPGVRKISVEELHSSGNVKKVPEFE